MGQHGNEDDVLHYAEEGRVHDRRKLQNHKELSESVRAHKFEEAQHTEELEQPRQAGQLGDVGQRDRRYEVEWKRGHQVADHDSRDIRKGAHTYIHTHTHTQ